MDEESLKETLEQTGLPAERGVYTGEKKPEAYYTFLRLLTKATLYADDKEKGKQELYRVTLFCKGDFSVQLERLLKTLEEAGYYINSVDAEEYETDTGYWTVPITIERLKEE